MADDWEYAGEEWKRKEEEKARKKAEKQARREARAGHGKFGRRAQAWFERAVQHFLATATDKRPALLPDIDIAALTAGLFAAQAKVFAKWVPVNAYLGNTFVTGEWQLDKPAIEAALPKMLRALEDEARAMVASQIATLDEWLAVDLAGKLPTGAEGGSAKLTPPLVRALEIASERRRKYWPRTCETCLEEFKPVKGSRLNCPECVRTGRPTSPEVLRVKRLARKQENEEWRARNRAK